MTVKIRDMQLKSWIKWLALTIILATGLQQAVGQAPERLKQARFLIDTLCAESFAGRGYHADGHMRAAKFLSQEMARAGLLPFPGRGGSYLQSFPVQPRRIDSLSLIIGKHNFVAGTELLPALGSADGKGTFATLDLGYGLPPYPNVKGKAVYFRETLPASFTAEQKAVLGPYLKSRDRADSLIALGAGAVIIQKEKLTHGFAPQNLARPVVEVLAPAGFQPKGKTRISVQFSNPFLQSANVLGYIKGSQYPDSFLVVTAHYDHLGMAGKSWFPGANDNASGVALLLAMAKHFSQPENQPRRSMAFILFGGEEAGLLGSAYFVSRDPVVPLSQISFLLNLDLMGNGSDGIMAVAGTDFPRQFKLLQSAHDEEPAFPVIRSRANAPNSDHYFFVKAGVPGFFIYTMGGPPHYHNVPDNAENLLLSHFEALFQLLNRFLGKIDQ